MPVRFLRQHMTPYEDGTSTVELCVIDNAADVPVYEVVVDGTVVVSTTNRHYAHKEYEEYVALNERILAAGKEKKMTYRQWEQITAKRYRSLGYTVVRADHSNYMPDYMAFAKNKLLFIECKRYLSQNTIEAVLDIIKKKQAKQFARLKELSYAVQVAIHIKLATREGVAILRNGKIRKKYAV